MDKDTHTEQVNTDYDEKSETEHPIKDWPTFWRRAKENAKKIGTIKVSESGIPPKNDRIHAQ
jgi:hypothetical protein